MVGEKGAEPGGFDSGGEEGAKVVTNTKRGKKDQRYGKKREKSRRNGLKFSKCSYPSKQVLVTSLDNTNRNKVCYPLRRLSR